MLFRNEEAPAQNSSVEEKQGMRRGQGCARKRKNPPVSPAGFDSFGSDGCGKAPFFPFCRRFVRYVCKQLFKKGAVVHRFHEEHFFRAFIGLYPRSGGKQRRSGRQRFYEQSVVLNSACDFSAAIEDKLSHHGAVRYVRIGQLLQDEL